MTHEPDRHDAADATSTAAWARLTALFEALVDRPADEQQAAIAEADLPPALRDQLQRMLAADRAPEDALASAIATVAATPGGPVPERLGPWQVLRELGRGGMGTVYLAERADAAYAAQVAIKLLRGALAAPELTARFRRERQLLATLDHPGIARLIDGGAAPDGTPYLVMEYVDGVPLDVWCDTRQLGVRARLDLVRRICDAVQHAHQALVVHRDLKPANILVTPDGTPKLLDFGIARLADEARGSEERTLYQAMTPSYASPEQLRGDPITTASDVWSLGVMLYRLLTGTPPHDLTGLSTVEIERRVTTVAIDPPSRRAGPQRARELAGDLDTVIGKALAVDPAQRYRTAAELSEDLRRWLAREPVLARRPTAWYRASSFTRRHPVGVTASVAALVTVVALTVTSIVQAQRANRERDLAAARQRVAEQATGELVSLLELADPNVTGDTVLTARDMLDRGAARILSGEVNEAEVRASLAVSLARVYRNLAAYDAAAPLIDTALAIRARVDGATSAPYVAVLQEAAVLQYDLGRYDSTVALQRQVLAQQAVVAPGDQVVTEASLGGLALALEELGEFEEAETTQREALAMARRLHGERSVEVSIDLLSLASVLRRLARYDEAVLLLEESLAIATERFGRRNLDVANTLNHLARTHALAGRAAEALPVVREAIDLQSSIHGGPHPETAASLGNLSGILSTLGRLDEAMQARRESHAMLKAIFGDDHPYIGASYAAIGEIALRQEAWTVALDAFRASRVVQEATLPSGAPGQAASLSGLGRALLALDRAGEAEAPLREALAITESTYGATDARTGRVRTALAEAWRALGRVAAADSLLGGES